MSIPLYDHEPSEAPNNVYLDLSGEREAEGVADVFTAQTVVTVEGRWAIAEASIVNKTFTLASVDRVAFFHAGRTFRIVGSTANDGSYTVASSALADDDTVITVSQTPASATGDGYLQATRTLAGTEAAATALRIGTTVVSGIGDKLNQVALIPLTKGTPGTRIRGSLRVAWSGGSVKEYDADVNVLD